ncbi:MAG: NnrU family protein [Hyphomicrobiales bacterium]|nr:NnrU family protein [Hyphomicrobiales bacterium]
MIVLALGLALFVLVHAVPMLPNLRGALAARIGEDRWRGVHSLIAAAGLGLVVWGFGLARAEGHAPWLDTGVALRHPMILAAAPVFPLLFAAFLPGRISAAVVHPMVTAVIVWAAAHLLIVGSAPGVLLFVVFLAWSLAARLSLARRKPRAAGPLPPFGRNDLIAVGLGLAVWAGVLWKGHLWLVGVAPLP